MKKLLSTLEADELFALSRSFRSDVDGESEEASAESEYKRGGKRMSERYLFRGKRVDNGEWITGSYCDFSMDSGRFYPHAIFYEKTNHEYEWTHIDISTIGQCTGFQDKEKGLAFEHDIYENAKGERFKIIWCGSGFFREMNKGNLVGLTMAYMLKSKRIGNIHDNKDLIESEVMMRESDI